MKQKEPSLIIALIPIIILIILLSINVWLFGDNTLSGSNQLTLLFSGAIAASLGLFYKVKWTKMLEGAVKSISSAMGALIILLLIGSLAGTWMLSGIVPTMIYYGMDILSPSIFLVATCVICAIVSLATGSSWSTIATIGIAMLGIGSALGISEGWIGGAIISGAYFGDKMSPLSDTTNLAPAMAGTDLISHIKYMTWTTVPSISITLLIFLIKGFLLEGNEDQLGQIAAIQDALSSTYNINLWTLLVPLIVVVMIIKKIPAIPALFFGTLLGGIFAVVFQSDLIKEYGSQTSIEISSEIPANSIVKFLPQETNINDIKPGDYQILLIDTTNNKSISDHFTIEDYNSNQYYLESSFNLNNTALNCQVKRNGYLKSSYIAVMNAMTVDFIVDTGNSTVNKLIETNGMAGMLGTIWLIICAMSFGGIMETTGFLSKITTSLMFFIKSRKSLVLTTSGTCLFLNVTASDQYLSIVIPGRMFANTYKKYGLDPKNLSRTLEDSATVTSPLVPWNTCGAYHSGVLGVATITYLPYCFFNLISPMMTILFAYASIKIAKLKSRDEITN